MQMKAWRDSRPDSLVRQEQMSRTGFGFPCGIGLLVLLLVATAAGADDVVDRGKYYRNSEYRFELWIPAGFSKEKPDEGEIAYFRGAGSGGYALIFEATDRESSEDFVRATREDSKSRFPGCKVKVTEGLEAAGHPTAILWHRKLEGNKDWKNLELISAGVELDEGEILSIEIQLSRGKGKKALLQMRSMLASFRWTGERGLKPFTGARTLDLDSGISYRLPLGYSAVDAMDGHLFTARNDSISSRISMRRVDADSARDALSKTSRSYRRLGLPWKFPHPGGARLRGAVYRPLAKPEANEVRVAVAVKLAAGPMFVLEVEGQKAHREILIQNAEVLGSSLAYTDMAAARQETAAAAADLDRALKKRDASVALKAAKILARNAFLPEARIALARAIPGLLHPDVVLVAVKALAREGPDSFDVLFRAARSSKFQKHPELMVALLHALGTRRQSSAIGFLLKRAARGDVRIRIAAIEALAGYTEEQRRVLKPLIRLMKKNEAAGRKADLVAREEWVALKPAYQAALKRLTGQEFASSASAEAWLRKNR